jgi:hypothetical protein
MIVSSAASLRQIACLLGSLAAVGCTGTRLIGSACPAEGCGPARVSSRPAWPDLPAPTVCGIQLSTAPVHTGGYLESCELFTLHGLGPATEQLYLSKLQVVMKPSSQVDVRLATAVPDVPDGEAPCSELLARPIVWVPLMIARGETDEWDFGHAPYPVTSQQRVLIDYQYVDLGGSVQSDVGAKLNLECQRDLPSVVSQSFTFQAPGASPQVVGPGLSVTLSGDCGFSTQVVVSRLYRPTQHIARYRVSRSGESDLLWETYASRDEWTFDLAEPLIAQPGEGFHWECRYENQDFVSYTVGTGAADGCSLFGIYYLPSGRTDQMPEQCAALR